MPAKSTIGVSDPSCNSPVVPKFSGLSPALIHFEKGQRKDDVAAAYRKKFTAEEGVLFIGKAQEKTPVFRTERRRNEQTGATYPWLVTSTTRTLVSSSTTRKGARCALKPPSTTRVTSASGSCSRTCRLYGGSSQPTSSGRPNGFSRFLDW
jgi:hypothetical protein